MATITNLPVGLASSIFIGDYGSSNVLKQIWSKRTGGYIIQDSSPRKFLVHLAGTTQSDFHNVIWSVNFLSDDDIIVRIAKGLPISDTNLNDTPPITGSLYTIFIAYPDRTTDKSYILNGVYNDNILDVNYNKDKPTQIPIKFTGTNRDFSVSIITKGNTPTLAASLGSRNPIT